MNRSLSTAYMSFVYLLLYLPIVVLVVFSFNNSLYSGLWHGATLKWYRELFHDASLLTIAEHSITVAILASTIATFIGLLGSVALFKYRFFGKRLLYGMIFVLIVLPDLIMGVAFLILFHLFHATLGFWTLLPAHVAFCVPFVMIILMGCLSGSDKNIFEAARDLGATDFKVFLKILVPMMMPAMISAWLLSFTLSFDDVIISSFVTGPAYQILPLYIYSSVRLGITPEINALCTLILGLTIILAVGSQLVLRKK